MNRVRGFLERFLAGIRGKHLKAPFKSRRQWIVFFAILLLLAGGLVLILKVETSYFVQESYEKKDVTGTTYDRLGKKLFKYSPDGVSCLNANGDVLWNSTFSMQSPIVDICESTAVVGDQQGTDVYIYNEDGVVGQFETLLPIKKVEVARQGVVAAVLEDEDVTWIYLYDTSGGEIAKMRTSVKESGYPVDVDLSPDGLQIMVSFLFADKGSIETRVSFYNFDAVGQAAENNLVNQITYQNEVVPSVFFVDNDRSAALGSDGFCVYKGKDVPEEKVRVSFEEEILSTFHEGNSLGLVFESDKDNYKYKLLVYNLNGRCTMKKYFNLPYRQVKMQEGNIILSNEKEFQVYSSRGRKRVDIVYEKAVEDVISVPGIGKYMVISSDCTEMIRVR